MCGLVSWVHSRLLPCSVCPSSAHRSGSSGRRTACLLSPGKQARRARCLLATTFGTVTPSSSSRSSLEHVVLCCPASFSCIFPMDCLHVQLHDGVSPWSAAGPVGT